MDAKQKKARNDKKQNYEFYSEYGKLVGGINRIRYIKQKQNNNQHLFNSHLLTIINQITVDQQPISDKQRPSFKVEILPERKSLFRSSTGKYIFNKIHKNNQHALSKIYNKMSLMGSGYKNRNSSSKEKENQQLFNYSEKWQGNNEDNILKTQGNSVPYAKQHRKQQPKQKEEIFLEKSQKYQQMRRQKSQLKDAIKVKELQQMKKKRQNYKRMNESREQSRKKLQNNYFQHLSYIKLDKDKRKNERIRHSEKNKKQLGQIQIKETFQIEKFQKHLILQNRLKCFIEERFQNHESPRHEIQIDLANFAHKL